MASSRHFSSPNSSSRLCIATNSRDARVAAAAEPAAASALTIDAPFAFSSRRAASTAGSCFATVLMTAPSSASPLAWAWASAWAWARLWEPTLSSASASEPSSASASELGMWVSEVVSELRMASELAVVSECAEEEPPPAAAAAAWAEMVAEAAGRPVGGAGGEEHAPQASLHCVRMKAAFLTHSPLIAHAKQEGCESPQRHVSEQVAAQPSRVRCAPQPPVFLSVSQLSTVFAQISPICSWGGHATGSCASPQCRA
mmetsp:Transcript_33708/g.78871  ORF Transcript_33708/g.78871 Transcript_33708/m.78871 type:complete len:257 (-) Transcript_33708:191-961(-)